jgi:hypothetical protein
MRDKRMIKEMMKDNEEGKEKQRIRKSEKEQSRTKG